MCSAYSNHSASKQRWQWKYYCTSSPPWGPEGEHVTSVNWVSKVWSVSHLGLTMHCLSTISYKPPVAIPTRTDIEHKICLRKDMVNIESEVNTNLTCVSSKSPGRQAGNSHNWENILSSMANLQLFLKIENKRNIGRFLLVRESPSGPWPKWPKIVANRLPTKLY